MWPRLRERRQAARGLLRAAEDPKRRAHLPLRQGRRGAARAVLVSLLEEGREDEEQVCGEGEAGERAAKAGAAALKISTSERAKTNKAMLDVA